jgi:serine phosphatase RsbU (regulator of sigma subunit)/PAS domain-containing protein
MKQKALWLIGAALCAGFVLFVWFNERRTLHQAQLRTDEYARFLATHLWNIDKDSGKQYVDLIARAGDYRSFRVIHADGEPFVGASGEEREGNLDDFLRYVGLVREVRLQSSIDYQGTRIGSVEAYWVNRNVYTYLYLLPILLFALVALVLAGFFRRARQERQLAERALAESRARLHTVVAGAPIILFALDRRGVFTVSEGKGLSKLNLKEGEIVGRRLADVYRDAPEILRDFERALSGETFSSVREVGGLVFDTWYSPLRGPTGELAGVIGVATDITDLQRAMQELARRDENMRQELSLAKTIHRALVPARLPALPGFEFGLKFVPCGDIGGDFVHFIHRPDDQTLAVIFADITGHGVPAALLSSMFKVLIDEILQPKGPPVTSISELNRRLTKQFPPGNFASTFCAVFDSSNRTMCYVKASQEPALLFRPGRAVEILDKGGPVLGILSPDVFGETVYEQHTVPLQPGDTIFFYTDGLIELDQEHGKMVERNELVRWLEQDISLPPQDLVEKIYARAVAFAGRTDLPDDVAALAVRVKPT